MNKEKFEIANAIKKFISDLDKYLINFPHKEIELKKNIYNEAYLLLKEAYNANITYDKLQKENDIVDIIDL